MAFVIGLDEQPADQLSVRGGDQKGGYEGRDRKACKDGCPGPLFWIWKPQRDLAGDARREKDAVGLFTSLAPFLGGCHMVDATPDELMAPVRQPTPHSSCERAPVGFLGPVLCLPLQFPPSCSHLYIFSSLSFPQITWLDCVICSLTGPELTRSCRKEIRGLMKALEANEERERCVGEGRDQGVEDHDVGEEQGDGGGGMMDSPQATAFM